MPGAAICHKVLLLGVGDLVHGMHLLGFKGVKPGTWIKSSDIRQTTRALYESRNMLRKVTEFHYPFPFT